jgi:BMFP domain-containing protein YqiC
MSQFEMDIVTALLQGIRERLDRFEQQLERLEQQMNLLKEIEIQLKGKTP